MKEVFSDTSAICTVKQLMEAAEIMPEDSRYVFDKAERQRKEVASQVLAQMPNAVIALQGMSSSGDIYKAVGNVALREIGDGAFSATIRNENGAIVQHAKLEKVKPGFGRSAALSYAVLNAAVGQLNMMQIAAELKEINEKLEAAKKRDYIKQINEVNNCRQYLKEIQIEDSTHKLQDTLRVRKELKTALDNLRDFICGEVAQMPSSTKPSFWENWGKSPVEKAKEHFAYIDRTLPTWYEGMLLYIFTASYIQNDHGASANCFFTDLETIVRKSGLIKKVELVPMIGATDPVLPYKKIEIELPRAKLKFAEIRTAISGSGGELLLPIRTTDLEDR